MVIKEITFGSSDYNKLVKLRTEILRTPLGLEMSEQDVATEDREFHIAAFDGAEVVGCVLLRPVDNQVIKLRQMAVSSTRQGMGVGGQLVRHAEKLAVLRGFQKIETHARVTALEFYKKLGYQAQGEEFTEVTIATIRMWKELG